MELLCFFVLGGVVTFVIPLTCVPRLRTESEEDPVVLFLLYLGFWRSLGRGNGGLGVYFFWSTGTCDGFALSPAFFF